MLDNQTKLCYKLLMTKIITRFAPSPTGFLHIGGARTALFNYLYAKRFNGEFLLRIEDTDFERSTNEAIQKIIDGLSWLGLKHDGDIVYQSKNAKRHLEVANQLLDTGHAYRCYATKEENEAHKKTSKTLFISPYRDSQEKLEKPYVIRLKANHKGETSLNDQVQGLVKTNNNTLDDMVLVRSDNTPTYMLAVVVDDYDMGVTHIIRGNDHLTNTFRQLGIYKAMGWQEPIYAHIPLIHGSDGAKLSKRHGALGVDAYREEMGILPEALNNYLLRLGWGHGEDEIIDMEQAIKWFDLPQVGRSPSRFDIKKLENLNKYYIKVSNFPKLYEAVKKQINFKLDEAQEEMLRKSVLAFQGKVKNLNEIIEGSIFIFNYPRQISEYKEAFIKCLQAEELKEALDRLMAEKGLDKSVIYNAFRVALTGQKSGHGVFDLVNILGKEDCLKRLNNVFPDDANLMTDFLLKNKGKISVINNLNNPINVDKLM